MARISFSALVEEIVGKLAGSVFQDSYGGFQIRTRVSPRNPQTKYQQLRRGEFGYLSAGWRFLTDVQRQTFIDAASTPPAALNLYLQSNINLTLIEEPTITDYVPSSDPGTMTIEFTDASPEGIFIKATGGTTVVPAGTKLLLQVTYQKAPTKIFTNPSQYSPVISFDEGTDLSIPTDILTEWQSRYGQLVADKRLCLKANLIDKTNGRRGADSVNCTITNDMATKYIPLAAFKDQESNVGAGSEQLFAYAMPSNTMASDLDKLIMEVYGVYGNFGNSKTIGFTINASTQNFIGSTSIAQWKVRVTIQRYSNTEINYGWELLIDQVVVANQSGFFSGLDFTAVTNISIHSSAAAANDINAVFGSYDLVKAP